jgi:hypothetical protein
MKEGLGPVAHSAAEAEEMIAALQQENPNSDVEVLRISHRVGGGRYPDNDPGSWPARGGDAGPDE